MFDFFKRGKKAPNPANRDGATDDAFVRSFGAAALDNVLQPWIECLKVFIRWITLPATPERFAV